jgi:uncharacterized protein (DUF2384 family)
MFVSVENALFFIHRPCHGIQDRGRRQNCLVWEAGVEIIDKRLQELSTNIHEACCCKLTFLSNFHSFEKALLLPARKFYKRRAILFFESRKCTANNRDVRFHFKDRWVSFLQVQREIPKDI